MYVYVLCVCVCVLCVCTCTKGTERTEGTGEGADGQRKHTFCDAKGSAALISVALRLSITRATTVSMAQGRRNREERRGGGEKKNKGERSGNWRFQKPTRPVRAKRLSFLFFISEYGVIETHKRHTAHTI